MGFPQRSFKMDPCKVFNGNMCFVCHKTIKEKELKKCSSCKLVFYCSKLHQKIHWKQHSRLCRIVREVDVALPQGDLKNDLDWFNYRVRFLMLCELKMGKKLDVFEVNMILFPNNCQICHKKSNLQACLDCLCVNYCSVDHKQEDFRIHKDICHLLALGLELDLLLQHSYYPDFHFREGPIALKDTMSSFIENNITLDQDSEFTLIQGRTLVSDLLTCPLSLLHAANLMNYKFKENIVLHIVGSSFLELGSLKSWEAILHINPQIRKLVIVFIGPEVNEMNPVISCEHCCRKLSFKFSKKLYHNFLNSSAYNTPDLICVFNCGFHEYQTLDTWGKSLPLLIQNKKIPLIFTSFTSDEAELDAGRLSGVDENMEIKISKNKFSSLRPYRDFEKFCIYFNNNYISIVSNE